jgi:hypothetical protein
MGMRKRRKIVVDTILAALRAGNTRRAACAAANINSGTFYRWLEEDAAFRDAVEKAEAEAEMHCVTIIRKAADENWTAAAWWLERKFPDNWGRRERFDHHHSGIVKIELKWPEEGRGEG